jgi:GGDEF domain-containing protein
MNNVDNPKFQDTSIPPRENNPQLEWSQDLATQIARSMVSNRPISKEQHLEEQNSRLVEENTSLNYELNHDKLTGLPNAIWFQKELGEAVIEHPGEIAVLFLDLDNFKTINDTEGHKAGDEQLKRLAAHILLDNVRTNESPPHNGEKRRSTEQEDLIGTGEFHLKQQGAARLHGDEFAVLLIGVKDPVTLEQIISRIQTSLANAKISVSIGGKIHEKGQSPEDLLEAADDLMYKQKEYRREQAALKKMDDLAVNPKSESFS